MSKNPQLSDAKRALLEKYLRGDLPQARRRTIPPRPPGVPIPLSFQQEQLWLAAQLAPGVPIDAEFITVSIDGRLDVAALERSFNEIIRRHEIMRTTFPAVAGRPIQVVHMPPAYVLPLVDLRGLPPRERQPEAVRLATEEARQGFDVERGPLLRATLVRLDDAEHKLFLVLHHLVFDCLSWYTVFLPELATVYEAFSSGRPSPLPELPIQYADYAHWQRGWLQGKELEVELAYWRERLAGNPASLDLPLKGPRPSVQTFRGGMLSVVLPTSLTEALGTLSRREGVTLFMALIAAFQTLLYRYSGQEDIPVGIDTGGRKQSEVESLIGFFLQTLVVRTSLAGNPTFRELLARVREVTLAAFSHDNVPFVRLVEELQSGRDPSRHPLFQVVVRLGPRLAPLDCGWIANPAAVDPGVSKYDLTLEVYETAEGAICRLEYNTDLFDASTMARLLEHFRTVLESVVANPEQRIADLPIAAPHQNGGVAVSSIGDGAGPTGRKPFVAPWTTKPFVVPWTPLHGQLLQIWEELLDVRPIGFTDDFFVLGGTSLLAVRLMARLEDVLGQRLPLSVLFARATIEHLAQAIMDGLDPELRSPLVQIQPGGNKRPFFFLHGEPTGAGFYVLTLARYLDEDQPFYILQSNGPDGGPPVPSVEAMAAAHVQVIRAFQPEGPYLLGGHCNGGIVAYEMARQLEARGQKVDLLVLLHAQTRFPAKLEIGYRAVASAGKLIGLNLEQQVVPYLLYRYAKPQVEDFIHLDRAERVRLVRTFGKASLRSALRKETWTRTTAATLRSKAESLVAVCRQRDWRAPVFWACYGYVPGPYAGRVTLFWWSQEPRNPKDPTMGWGKIAGEVEVQYVPGSQGTMLANLAGLGEQLRARLASVEPA